MKRLIAAVFAAMLVAGCNTMEGIGEDVQAAGSKIDRSAERHGANNVR